MEVWLGNLLQEARKSLHAVIRTAAFAIKDSSFKLIEFLDTFPAQVISISIDCILTTILRLDGYVLTLHSQFKISLKLISAIIRMRIKEFHDRT